MRCLVTGGAGFLGSHLVDRLLSDGHHVVALDDFSTGSRDNVSHLEDEPRFELIEHNVIEPYEFEVDRIYNLACPASPKHYQRDPVRTMLTSVRGVLNGLELAERQNARFFQASTSEVYGDPDVHPQPESYVGHVNPTGPRACYDEGKRAAETLCFDFHRSRGVEVRIARIFNTYGPRMSPDDGRVVSNFIVQALRGESLTVYGDGSQTRSFCFVDDLIDAMCLVMNSDRPGPVNIGNPEEFSMNELAQLVRTVVGTETALLRRPLPVDDPKQRRPEITRAQALGFRPQTALEDGLRQTTDYFRARLKRES